MKIRKIELVGDPSIGLFSLSTEEKTFVPQQTKESTQKQINKTLGTEVIQANVYNSPLIGLFTSANKKGIILPKTAYKEEMEHFKKHFDNVTVINEYTALGNLVSVNDKGFVASPALSDSAIKKMEKTFKVKGKKIKIADLDVTGSCISATNKGFFAHPETEKLEEIKETLKVKGKTGTINYGNPYVKSGVIANTEGILTGSETSNFELGRVDEALSGE